MEIWVLRLGHRPHRDQRITTHVMLAARAFGAHGALYTGVRDESMERSVHGVVENWGGSFKVRYVESWRKALRDWRERGGRVIHLTMYGLPVQRVIDEIRADPSPKLIVVGGAKVPGELYGEADWNVAVTSQPHSEVSALAVFLHMLYEGRELELEFEGAKLRVIPQERGKRVERLA
ncbi:tRNA (cytidine(56)-2'-O)-methyltransferase [Candidatus Bathyarchaeota archaeon]|nr:tRNA (cytidine(56)-2'-O)-methyltransferase [Candidatus Bathyarchaeota archaeon]